MNKYNGYTPVVARETVLLLDDNGNTVHKCRVIDALASQFTVSIKGTVKYFMYSDRGVTWRSVTSRR